MFVYVFFDILIERVHNHRKMNRNRFIATRDLHSCENTNLFEIIKFVAVFFMAIKVFLFWFAFMMCLVSFIDHSDSFNGILFASCLDHPAVNACEADLHKVSCSMFINHLKRE